MADTTASGFSRDGQRADSAFLRNAVILCACFGLLLISVLIRLEGLIAAGGHAYQQGDWLISNATGWIRRGAFGSAILWASDATGIGVLAFLGWLQAVCVGLLICGLGVTALAARVPDRLLLLLISPAFLMGWFYDFDSALRKEVLAYLAFLPFLVAAMRPGLAVAMAGLGLLLYAVAVTAHEGLAFIAPFLALTAWIALPEGRMRRALPGAVLALAALGVGAALLLPAAPDVQSLCDPLLHRGVGAHVCKGAIAWLPLDSGVARGSVAQIIVEFSQTKFFIAYGLALVPVGIALAHAPEARRWIMYAVMSGLAFAPLYIVAVDWGRWIALHMAGIAFVALTLCLRYRPDWLTRPVRPVLFWGMLAASVTWGVDHVAGEVMTGIAMGVWNIVAS